MKAAKRIIDYTGETKVATSQDIQEAFAQKYSQKNIRMLSFYNSEFDMIITDPSYMVLPIDDRIVTRAHGIFEAMSIRNFQFYSIDLHMKRFEQSAKKTGIPFPMEPTEMKKIMTDVVQNSYTQLQKDGYNEEQLSKITIGMRAWISSGRNDFGIYSEGKEPIFYCLTYVDFNAQMKNKIQAEEGVKEFSTLPQKKVELLQTCKSTVYLRNTLQANYSKAHGGYQGIGIDQNGKLLEQAMANIAYIDKYTKEFVHVPYDKIIQSTTLKKVIDNYIEPVLMNEEKKITKITQKYFTPEEVVQNAQEFISFGGDKIVPIIELDNGQIHDGRRGELTKCMQDWYNKQRVTQKELVIPFEQELELELELDLQDL